MNTFEGQCEHDVAIINRICNTDQNALEVLYHEYYPRLFRFIGRIVWCEALIDEIINDVMYTVWEKAETYNHQCRLSTWIFGIAYNKARQALRHSGQFKSDSLDDMDVDSLELGCLDPGLERLETSEWLDEILKVLSPDQRAVIELTYFQGLHYSEIAVLMDCPENTVKTRMHHARKILALHRQHDETLAR